MQNKEIEEVKYRLNFHSSYAGMPNDCCIVNRKDVTELLQYIEQLENKVKEFYDGEVYTAKQLKKVEENQKKYFINKQVIRDKIELYKRLELESFNRDSIQADEYRAIIKALQELLDTEQIKKEGKNRKWV